MTNQIQTEFTRRNLPCQIHAGHMVTRIGQYDLRIYCSAGVVEAIAYSDHIRSIGMIRRGYTPASRIAVLSSVLDELMERFPSL